MNPNNKELVRVLKEGGVVVMPTDTIYGIVGLAENKDTVKKIYKIRKRAPKKPCIILIASEEEVSKFSVNLTEAQKNTLKEYWPGPVSIILDCPEEKFTYLHRGTHTLAFRVSNQEGLQSILRSTGPLVAPSANPEGLPPAKNIEEAKNYFGDEVDLYIDGDNISTRASKIIRLHSNGEVNIIRE